MAAVVDLSAALSATLSPDPTLRGQAEAHLDQLKQANFPSYLASITSELGNEERPDDVRQAAGLQLKNSVDAKDNARRQDLAVKWRGTDAALKQHIRDVLLRCLHSPKADVRKTVALAIAKIAAIDFANGEWSGLITSLLSNMSAQPPTPAGTRQATLTTLGYLCEEVEESHLSPENVNMILTAIVAGMGATESDEARLAAITALSNAVHLARSNFEVDNERTYLMQVVCECTQAGNQPMRVAAFQCLQNIADSYYPKLQAYMTQLYTLTTKAMKEDDDEVATQVSAPAETGCTLRIRALAYLLLAWPVARACRLGGPRASARARARAVLSQPFRTPRCCVLVTLLPTGRRVLEHRGRVRAGAAGRRQGRRVQELHALRRGLPHPHPAGVPHQAGPGGVRRRGLVEPRHGGWLCAQAARAHLRRPHRAASERARAAALGPGGAVAQQTKGGGPPVALVLVV
jgi:hypothetical protein